MGYDQQDSGARPLNRGDHKRRGDQEKRNQQVNGGGESQDERALVSSIASCGSLDAAVSSGARLSS
jgi:hypothetical protein